MGALPWIAAGFSALQGAAGYASGKTNEKRAIAEGKAAVQTGEAEKARQQRINLSQEGTFEADIAAQGATLDSYQSPMLAYLGNVKQGALTAEDFSYKGKLTKYGKKLEAQDYRARGYASLVSAGAGIASSLAPTFGGSKTPTLGKVGTA
jgi:hypothetical protein